MQRIISSRHFHADADTKAFIERRLDVLEGEYNKLTSARVVLDQQKLNYHAEIILHGKHVEIEAEGKATDLLPAIDLAIEKAERQLRKHLDKIQDHHHMRTSEVEKVLNGSQDDDEDFEIDTDIMLEIE
jgi:putative sigma-54 modulation protein